MRAFFHSPRKGMHDAIAPRIDRQQIQDARDQLFQDDNLFTDDESPATPRQNYTPSSDYSPSISPIRVSSSESFPRYNEAKLDVPDRTLSPVSQNAMNGLNISSSPSQDQQTSKHQYTTIRSVGAEPNSEPFATNGTVKRPPGKENMPHATKTPALSTSHSSPPLSWQNGNANPGPNGLVRTISAEFGLTTKYSNNNLHLAAESPASLTANSTSPVLGSGISTPQWSSAVGGSTTGGKSGRVINRLMSENDMLKRDLNIQRLSNEEAKQAARMAEAKCAAMTQDYENQLHEAEVNKSLLKRRDRQLDELKSLIDGEKRRARKAEENEKTWKELLEKTENDAKRKVEQAEGYVQLMEGRVSTMARHWQDQKGEVNKSIGKLGKEIKVLVKDRRHDDDQIRILAEITAQHKEEMNKALRDNTVIRKIHEDYKAEKEQSLTDIKQEAKKREETQMAAIEEANRLVKELKWSIGVSKNFRDTTEASDEATK